MPEINPVWVAITAIKDGISANRGLAAFREAGGSIGRQTWLRLYSEIKQSIINRGDEMTAAPESTPMGNEVTRPATWTMNGYLQQVEVYYREKGSVEVFVRPFSVKSDSLMTRGDAVQKVLDTFGDHAAEDQYSDQVVLFAAYTGTYSSPGFGS